MTEQQKPFQDDSAKNFGKNDAELEKLKQQTLEKQDYNYLEQEYLKRGNLPIPEYSLVALLIERIVFFEKKERKLITGQIGYVTYFEKLEGRHFYLVYFLDLKKYSEDLVKPDSEKQLPYEMEYNNLEQAIFLSGPVERNHLVPLHSFIDMPEQNKENITNNKITGYDNFRDRGAPEKLQMFLQSEIHKLIPQSSLEDFQPGQLVTVLIDSMKVNTKNEVIIGVYAGQIGIVINPETDRIIQENGEILVEKISLDPHETMVYFPHIPLLDLFPIVNDSYKKLQPFEENQCMIFNKAYLISLSGNKPE